MMKIKKLEKIFVFGAGHGLGLGFVHAALNNSNAQIFAFYNRKENANNLLDIIDDRLIKIQIDVFNEDLLSELAKKHKDIDLMINTIGFLHNDHIQPEKSLRDINTENLLHSFKVNTIVTPLLLKHFKNSFTKKSAYLVLGAKVGSISDNEMGGWYGYRASKAALNMMIKNIDIELKRTKKNIRILCFHPGTTETELSKPFLGGIKHKIWHENEAGENLIHLIEKVYEQKDLFYFWDGEVLPW